MMSRRYPLHTIRTLGILILWTRHLERAAMNREYSVVIERDEEGYFVASVPSLPGCHTQARSLDELMDRVREAIRVPLQPPD